MSANVYSQTKNDLCKKHAARAIKDARSICPSKLSKRELEDLYYSLMENNLELKQTINALNENNRVLSTKVQRMTAQTKNNVARDCCAAGKAVINEQKAAIADLAKANEAMAERVRRLNTQLCSAKQFLKQHPNARHCYKCYVNATTSIKSTTSLQNKVLDANLKSLATSAVDLDRENHTTRTAETNTTGNDVENDEKGDVEKVCNENKCKSTMEDLKQKIEELEEELAKTHSEYSRRMTQLETQVSQLQAAAVRARSELSLRAENERRAPDRDELEMQLSMEKKKVAEMEMRLKAAELSQQAARAIEEHLTNANRLDEKQLRQASVQRHSIGSLAPDDRSPRPMPVTSTPVRANELSVPEDKLSKSDDSGYADQRRESDPNDKSINKANQELLKRISELQAQLDALNASSVEKDKAELGTSPYPKTTNYGIEPFDEEELEPQKISPKHPQISITEPEVKVSKERIAEWQNLDINPNIKDEPVDLKNRKESFFLKGRRGSLSKLNKSDNKKKNEGNETDIDKSSTRYVERKSDNPSITEQADEINAPPCRDYERSGSVKSANVNKDGFDSEFPKQSLETEARFSLEPEYDTTKPDKDVDDVSENKSKRYSPVLFEGETNNRNSEQMKPKTPRDNISEVSNIKRPSILHTRKSLLSPTTKADNSNFQQIPGPLPVHDCNSKPSKRIENNKTAAQNWKKAKKYGRKKTDAPENKNKIVEKDKSATGTKEHLDDRVTNDRNKRNNDGKNITNDNGDLKRKYDDEDVENNAKNPEENKIENQNTLNEPSIYGHIPEKQSNEKLKEFATQCCAQAKGIDDNKVAREQHRTRNNDDKIVQPDVAMKFSGEDRGIIRIDEFKICQHYATICTCPEKPSTSLTMFRSCSGTLTVSALPNSNFRRCSCSERAARNSCGSVLRDVPVGTSTPKTEHRALSPGLTYSLDEGKRSRATSPANTDNEISVMTDLPTEKDASPREILSPGEHVRTDISTDTSSLRNDITLSEGEVPTGKYPGRRTSKSVGEVQSADDGQKDNSIGEQKSSTEKMEAALQAISQELARCRWLLQSQRTREQAQSKDVASGLISACDSMTPRKAEGKSRVECAEAPNCLFIMHIATLVLADETVFATRDARFALSWKFLDSDATLTHMGVERVINLHFYTQHDFEMTKDVVKYFKNEHMVIMMCEVDSKEPFATCSLPLRQMLSNINRRVNLSLPLRAFPSLEEQTTNTYNASEDFGVLEVWCMLHCEQRHLPQVDRTIAEQSDCDDQVLEITVLWLTLNENCEAMRKDDNRKLYVAYTFLGRHGAELETPISLPKPKHYTDKCIYNFRKSFNLTEMDMRVLEHMASCRSQNRRSHNSRDCIVFTVVSEPPEDPLGLDSCEDIGFAFLYLGDLLARGPGDSFTELLPVRAARAPGGVCGVLAVQVDGLYLLRARKEKTN